MAEGMVGWIQLLGEQYCCAVIVCSSTCSGFPGLGPLASNPMSRYTTIFCLLAITPAMTRRRQRRMRTRTKIRTRMSIVRTATRLLDLNIYENRLKPSFCTDKTSNVSNRVDPGYIRVISVFPWFLANTVFEPRIEQFSCNAPRFSAAMVKRGFRR